MKGHQVAGVLFSVTLFSSVAVAKDGKKLGDFPTNPNDRPVVQESIKEAVSFVRVNDYATAMKKMKVLDSLPNKTPSEARDIANMTGVITVWSDFTVH